MRAQKRGPNINLPDTQNCEVKTLFFNVSIVLIVLTANKKGAMITAIILYNLAKVDCVGL